MAGRGEWRWRLPRRRSTWWIGCFVRWQSSVRHRITAARRGARGRYGIGRASSLSDLAENRRFLAFYIVQTSHYVIS